MKQLPNNCTCSDIAVHPANYLKCAKSAINKKWYIHYRFYDPRFREDKYKRGKLVVIKSGVNRIKDLAGRREAVRALVGDEWSRLQQGYNPILDTFETPLTAGVDQNTSVYNAVVVATNTFEGAKSTIADLNNVKDHFCEALEALGYTTIPISLFERRHVYLSLEHLSKQRQYSNNRYNKVRAYVQILFKELVKMQTIDVNPVDAIQKKKTVKKLKQILSIEQRKRVVAHLKENQFAFYRYCEIYFHSGCRTTELLAIKKEDVNLSSSSFVVTVKKGRSYEQQHRPINLLAYEFWKQLVTAAHAGDYIFSEGLEPGPEPIHRRQIPRRWKRHVKDKLNIQVDFSALKHLHTDLVDSQNGLSLASAANGHKSTTMVEKHYAVNRNQRDFERLKNLNISLG